MKKRPSRSRKPPPSINEKKLEMVMTRASNTFTEINQEVSKGIGLFMRAVHGRKGTKSPWNMATDAEKAIHRAINLTDALKRDLLTMPLLMTAIGNEMRPPTPVPPPFPPGTTPPAPRLLEV